MIETAINILIFISTFLISRIVLLLYGIWQNRSLHAGFTIPPGGPGSVSNPRRRATKTMIVAGSGGHTSEMMKLVSALLNTSYNPRHYIVAETDSMSVDKIRTMETSKGSTKSEYIVTLIPRSREVMQSWLTTILSTGKASIYSIYVVFRSQPDMVLCNGPGTCVPLCFAAFLATVLGLKRVKILFVESLCRVTTMSLTGRILYFFADEIIVQWPELKQRYPLTTYLGRIV